MRALELIAALTAAFACTACVQLVYDHEHIDTPRAPEIVDSLVVGVSDLDEALRKLGAPLDVWELRGDSVAIVYGSLEIHEWSWKVSVPVSESADASFNYEDTASMHEGYVLIFDLERRLTLVRSGLLRDLALDVRRTRPEFLDE